MKPKVPPIARGRIKAVRRMLRAQAQVSIAARKAQEKAEARYGVLSPEYAEATAYLDEATDLMKRLYRLVKMRLDELERPFAT